MLERPSVLEDGAPLMAVETIGSLVEALAESGLLSPPQLEELRHRFARRSASPGELTRWLRDREWLTPYQLEQVAQGHAYRLVLGHYVLLELLGEGGMGQVFK